MTDSGGVPGDFYVSRTEAGAERGTGLVPPPMQPARKRRGLIAAMVGIVVAAALAATLVLVPGGGPNAEAAAAVLRAVNGTLADKTAHVRLDMQVSAGAVSMTGSGSGDIDMNQNAMQVQLSMAAGGQSLDLRVIYLGGTVYEGVPGLSQLEPGKSWVSLDLSALTQSTPSPTGAFGLGNNPTAMLRLLAQRGTR
jgi:hypothetical protein